MESGQSKALSQIVTDRGHKITDSRAYAKLEMLGEENSAQAELMLHRNGPISYLIYVHPFKSETQNDWRAILLLILRQHRDAEWKGIQYAQFFGSHEDIISPSEEGCGLGAQS